MTTKGNKGELYAKELDGARLRGEWESDTPTRIAGSKGEKVTWPELIRKYVKHNPEQQVTPSVAGLEQQIHSNILAFQRDTGGYSDASHDADLALPNEGETTFPTPLPRDQSGQGWSGKEVLQATRGLEELGHSVRGIDSVAKHGIAALRAYAMLSLGDDEAAIGILHDARFLEDVDAEVFKAGEHTEDYSVALMLMGFTVYGMANERLHSARKDKAFVPFVLAGYARAIDLHEGVRGGKRANAFRGLPADEIEAWAETAIYRNAMFSVRTGDLSMGLNALRAYQAHVGRWPSNFRQTQRNVIYRTYLNVLTRAVEKGGYTPPPAPTAVSTEDWRSSAYQRSVVDSVAARAVLRDFEGERVPRHGQVRRMLGADANGITSRTTSTRRPAPHRVLRPANAMWSNELLTVQNAAATCIQRSSEFPRAGKVNISALHLADDLVRGWQLNGEQGGEFADEVVEILYNLSKITFHSQRISRHLFTLLVAAEAYDEARRALELYMNIFDKAKEADAAETTALLEESKKRKDADKQRGYAIEANEVPKLPANGIEEAKKAVAADQDDDETYISTLLFGAHVSCRYLDDPEGGDKLARKALAALSAAGSLSDDRSLSARARRIAGTARAAWCARQGNPAHRQVMHDEALSLLKQSATLDDQSSETFYQLAYLQAEMRDVTYAVRSARRALELEPADVQSWHLLALLLSSQKDYRGALRIAEEGLGEAEDDDEADAQTLARSAGAPLSPTAASAFRRSNSNGGAPIAVNGASKTTVVRTALLSVDFPPSYAERAESVLRLMISHNALEEIVEGCDAAIEGQREIFGLFHRRIASSLVAPPPRKALTEAKEPHSHRGKLSTLLAGGHAHPSRFGSLSGMGQSGASLSRKRTIASSLHRHRHPEATDGPASAGAVPLPAAPAHAEKEDETLSPVGRREAMYAKKDSQLLGSLWLMSAASFRRAGKLDECRVAVQEAERIDAARSDVWIQLALWFESDDAGLAIGTLYKALACEGDNVAAVVHLARLFLANPELSPSTYSAAALTKASDSSASPRPTGLAHAVNGTRDGTIDAGAQAKGSVPGGTRSHFATAAEARGSTEAHELSAASLAEGLLTSVTSTNGWDCPEAWLFLGQVARRTGRLEKARQCLEYALALEQTKPIRPLSLALRRP